MACPNAQPLQHRGKQELTTGRTAKPEQSPSGYLPNRTPWAFHAKRCIRAIFKLQHVEFFEVLREGSRIKSGHCGARDAIQTGWTPKVWQPMAFGLPSEVAGHVVTYCGVQVRRTTPWHFRFSVTGGTPRTTTKCRPRPRSAAHAAHARAGTITVLLHTARDLHRYVHARSKM